MYEQVQARFGECEGRKEVFCRFWLHLRGVVLQNFGMFGEGEGGGGVPGQGGYTPPDPPLRGGGGGSPARGGRTPLWTHVFHIYGFVF